MRYPRDVPQISFQRARSDEKKRQRAAALTEAARAVALESGVASVTLTAVANRAGMHYSAVRRYFSSHKEVLLRLATQSWQRWAEHTCATLDRPGPATPARVAEALADGLVADPLFCDMLANLHLHLEHEVDLDRVVEVKRDSTAAALSIVAAVQRTLPELGQKGALDLLLAAYSLAATLWQMAHPPAGLADAYALESTVPPDWNLDFRTALTRLLTATCVGLTGEPADGAATPTPKLDTP